MLEAFMIIKNGIRLGYPFVESIASVLPFVNSITIVDGHSDDGTWEFLNEMNALSEKIKILRTVWGDSKTGSEIAHQTNFAKQMCFSDWLLYVQADEVWHPESLKNLSKYIQRYPNALSFSFNFAHLSLFKWMDYNPAYSHAVRLIRNIPEITSEHDAWTFTVPPGKNQEIDMEYPIYHCGASSPCNSLQKHINHAKLYPDLPEYQKAGENARKKLDGRHYEIKKPSGEYWQDNPYPLPEILKHLVGCEIYEPNLKLLK